MNVIVNSQENSIRQKFVNTQYKQSLKKLGNTNDCLIKQRVPHECREFIACAC